MHEWTLCAPAAPRGSVALAQSQVPMWLIRGLWSQVGIRKPQPGLRSPGGRLCSGRREMGSPHPRTPRADQVGGW